VAAIDQLRRGATAAAREGLSTLITEYPTHEKAAEAQMLIADAYAQEGNRIAADSVYALVINKYAGPPEVISRSIYKRAMALKEVGQTTESLKLFQTIVDKYPRADVHDLAVEMIRTLKKP
jgi:TolA-binding protein